MPKCPFCDFLNPVEAVACRECHAELKQPSPQTSPDDHDQTSTPPDPAQVDNAFTPDEPADPFEAELCELLAAGNQIEAIRRYRTQKGGGLKEAKDAVEVLARQRGLPITQAGCGTASLLLMMTCGGLWYLL